MGNHNVGRAMATAAKVFWIANGDAEVTPKMAMDVLDAAGEDFIGADAEFDDEMITWTPLSHLVAIAFGATPQEVAALKGELEQDAFDGAIDAWYEGTCSRFRAHFKFC